MYDGKDEYTIVECDEDGKCWNCKQIGLRFALGFETSDEEEVPEKYKMCAYCMVSKLGDEGWRLYEP